MGDPVDYKKKSCLSMLIFQVILIENALLTKNNAYSESYSLLVTLKEVVGDT